MPRALLALCLSLFATAAFANRTVCTEDPTLATAKVDKPVAAAPVAPNGGASHPAVATSANATSANATSAGATANSNPAHATRPRVISARWQSLLPGMIR